MLQQEQRVVDKVLLPCRDDLLLDGYTFGIGNATEMDEVNMHHRLLFVRFSREETTVDDRGSAVFL
jgi:hypothetical protein